MQCALALVTLSVGLVHCWEIAVTTGNQLEFYIDGIKTHSIADVQFKKLTALTYDAIHKSLLLVNEQSDSASILRVNLTTNKSESLVTRKRIEDIAFDPVRELLFWTEDKSIFWISIKPEFKNNACRTLITMDDGIPMAIAVDSCKGYVYWTNINTTKSTIERARFDGSEREVLKDIRKPINLAINQHTKEMLWAEYNDEFMEIKKADLNGKNVLQLLSIYSMQPKVLLTASKDYVYSILNNQDKVYIRRGTMFSASNDQYTRINIPELISGGIAAYYETEECEVLLHNSVSLLYNLVTNASLNIPADYGLFCVHGIKVKGESHCKCAPGYIGERCDVSVCQNYCFRGDCNVSGEGPPECRCSTGYSGGRCEISMCSNYCLNNGVCSLNEQNEKVCQCNGNYEGSRCESIQPPTHNSEEKNLSLVDLVSNLITKKMYVIVEVKSP